MRASVFEKPTDQLRCHSLRRCGVTFVSRRRGAVCWCRFKTYNDNAAPLLEEQYPKKDQFNVSEDETIGLWFNEAIYNVSGANVSITPKGGQPITIQLDDESRVEVANEEGEVLVYPTHLFASRTEHTVTVPPRMLEDWSENLYAGTDFKFTTGDRPVSLAPSASSFPPRVKTHASC